MNIQVDTLEYATALEQAGIPRAHAEAIARLQARTVRDLVDHELVTKDFLRSELAQLRSELGSGLAASKSNIRSEFAAFRSDLRLEFAAAKAELRDDIRTQFGRLELRLRALQYQVAIGAFAISLVVLLSRLIT